MTNTATSASHGHQHQQALGVDAVQFLHDFEDYLRRVKGLAPGTIKSYCFWVRRFLAAFCGTSAPDWSALRGPELAAFVQKEASRLLRNGREAPGVALRVLLRYLSFLGAIQDGLQGAIPQRPRWRHVGLPRHIPALDIERVVSGALDGSGRRGLRNHAILLLLSRTGLRAHEVAQLSLDDIDWTEGTICIRSNKTHTERRLPLAHDVGEALSIYLKHGRPACSFRTIFLRVIPPFDPFTGSAAVCRIARRALTRAGILNTPAAAHLFRHSAATRMLRGGATFKEIADVLGHASIGTTAVYAKLDIPALSRVAMQWPENAP
jgi:site-specific recombinase XerD